MLQLREITYLTALAIMIGLLLRVGQPVLLPVLIAIITLYVLSNTTRRLGRVPFVGRMPEGLRLSLVLFVFTVLIVLLFSYVIDTFAKVAAILPRYEANLDVLVVQIAGLLGLSGEPTWESLKSVTIDRFRIEDYIAPVLLSLRGLGGTLFLVVLYALFFTAERAGMKDKLALALSDQDKEHKAIEVLDRINARVGDYLSVKTVVNVILGALSYAVMLAFGIDFALFWAILIALLNYIPYIGSLIGVLFPVVLSLAQFGSLPLAAAVLVTLTVAQLFVAGYLEPHMMSRAFNLSPFVVLFALAFWSALWGLPGAILAVPLTAVLIIVFAELDTTRPLAIMLSASGKI